MQAKDFPVGPVVKISPSSAGGGGSIAGRRAKIPNASRPKNQNVKQRQYCNKFNKDFLKIMVHIKKKTEKKETMEARRQWNDIFKMLKDGQPGILYLVKPSFKK